MNRNNVKKVLVRMVMRERKILQEHLRIHKKYVMVMFVCMNSLNTSDMQRMNVRENQQIYTLVIWKRLWKSTNMIMEKF